MIIGYVAGRKNCPQRGNSMGRKSREHRERRERHAVLRETDRASRLEDELRQLVDGDAVFWTSRDCPDDFRETNLEDILAFESVGSGKSLFDGLQENGIDLPHPDKLDEQQSADKICQVMAALQDLQIFLIGFEDMSPREFYRTLWSQTLWEGCYVKKRHPEALTIMDVSHSIPRSQILKVLEEAAKASSIH